MGFQPVPRTSPVLTRKGNRRLTCSSKSQIELKLRFKRCHPPGPRPSAQAPGAQGWSQSKGFISLETPSGPEPPLEGTRAPSRRRAPPWSLDSTPSGLWPGLCSERRVGSPPAEPRLYVQFSSAVKGGDGRNQHRLVRSNLLLLGGCPTWYSGAWRTLWAASILLILFNF